MSSILKWFHGSPSHYDVSMRKHSGHSGLRRVKSGPDIDMRNIDLIFISKERVRSWAMDFNKLLEDPSGLQMFLEFLKKEVSQENIYFWCSCQKYKGVEDGEERRNLALAIVKRHLDDDAMEPVNIDARSIHKIQDVLAGDNHPDKELFTDTQKRIYNLMKTDTFPRFLKSDVYTRLSNKHNHDLTDSSEEPTSAEKSSWNRPLDPSSRNEKIKKKVVVSPTMGLVEEMVESSMGILACKQQLKGGNKEGDVGNYLDLPQQFLSWLNDPNRERLDNRMSSPL